MIMAGADNRPPMLEKSLYDSWKSLMKLYIENRENGIMILDSVLNGPLVWPTVVQEDGTTRKKTYAELSATEKIQADCDLKATNIVLVGCIPWLQVGFPELYKELEVEILGDEVQLMGIHFLQLELRLGKNPTRKRGFPEFYQGFKSLNLVSRGHHS
ncbi:hypothetical protein Tco_1003335 [Tanacetum coccineum]|uniref:Integrase, catalytic region, zinc finger, CCHC-type, peptidase aspartic, catalytic n=1 Tax=Tanacetum coccineum TaxID=301880 RepID=A0ABQ5FAP2_9ASTR